MKAQSKLLPVVLICGMALAVSAEVAHAADVIQLRGGGRISGKLESIAADKVIVTTTGARASEEQVPVDAIDFIRFDGEPSDLQIIRSAIKAGRYPEAMAKLGQLPEPSGANKQYIETDVQYYQALAAAQEALSGAGGSVREAGSLMNTFVAQRANSYHILEARVLLGDLLGAVENYDAAMEQYAALTSAFWPGTQMRGHVARGQALRAANRAAEAQAEFERALEIAGTVQVSNDDVQQQVVAEQTLAARLGLAGAWTDQANFDQAVELVNSVIKEAAPENATLHAQAYNTLGTSLRAAGKPRDALLAFLHVDVLYSTQSREHAEALANLAELWQETGQRQRAGEALDQLRTRYGDSKWAKQVATQ